MCVYIYIYISWILIWEYNTKHKFLSSLPTIFLAKWVSCFYLHLSFFVNLFCPHSQYAPEIKSLALVEFNQSFVVDASASASLLCDKLSYPKTSSWNMNKDCWNNMWWDDWSCDWANLLGRLYGIIPESMFNLETLK